MKYLHLILLILLLAPVSRADVWYANGKIDYTKVQVTITNPQGATNYKWHVSVSYIPEVSAWVYSGPPIPQHLCTPDGIWGERIYIWVAPPYSKQDGKYASTKAPRHLQIYLTSMNDPKLKLSFYVTPEMWQNGEWKAPKLNASGDNPGYVMKLEKVSE